MYIKDICKVTTLFHFILFADDTNIFCSGKDLNHLLDTVEKGLKTLKRWFDLNKLSLNTNKTNFIIFSNRKIDQSVKITIDNVQLEQVHDVKFLGVIIDHKLCWQSHVAHVKSKIYKSLGILQKVKYMLCPKSMLLLYNTLILPYMAYCAEIWGKTYKTTIQPVIVLQKRTVRIINRADYNQHTHELFINSRILKFNDLVVYKIANLIYRIMNNMVPQCIKCLFETKSTPYDLRGSSMLAKPKARTNTKLRSLSVQGVNVWNCLKDDLKLCTSLFLFKNKLKANLINSYLE